MQFEKLQYWGKRLLPAVGLLLLPVALYLLHHELKNISYHDVVANIRKLPVSAIILAVIFTLLNYLVLTGYDLLGLRFMGRALHAARACMASFIGFAFSNSIGFFMVSSGMVRLGLYSNWGLSAGDVAGILAFNGVTFLIGLMLVGGGVLMLGPSVTEAAGPVVELLMRGFGGALLAAVLLYMWCCFRRKPLKILSWQVPVPSPGMALAQLVISIVDWALAAGVLYVLLPKSAGVSFIPFFGVFMVAQMLGVASQMPGGIGVFEATVVKLLNTGGDAGTAASLIGPLLVYRAIYYILPLLIAAVLLTTHTLVGKRKHFQQLGQVLGTWMPLLAPRLFTVGVFVSGLVLLLSGVLPTADDRLNWLHEFLPLSVIEASHFLAGLAGLVLIFLARGLQLRLNAAYWMSLVMLAAGIPLTLLRGLDYEEAAILAVALLAMLPCRSYFYRKTPLAEERFPWGWVLAIVLTLLSAGWLGTFSFQHLEYSNDLWWKFALLHGEGDAPRFLRVMVGVCTLTLGVGLWRFMRPAKPAPSKPTPEILARAADVIRRQPETRANLALLGDKPLLFSDGGDAFLMYGINGRSWVAMGDAVGNPEAFRELAWKYREMCDLHRGWCVFYEIGREQLPLYLDLGLTPLKIGEEARIPLKEFNLAGAGWKSMRSLCNRMEQAGVEFGIVPPEELPAILPELRGVSDAWLGMRRTREKGFSLGFFDEAYLKRFPVAVLRHGGRVAAFANVWLGADQSELSVDLMRHRPDAPPGSMDYLFVRLMQWGRAQGYASFNMGISPLSGLEARPLAPAWAKFGSMIYRHGEHFYNFNGLRRYKEKFQPVWEPKYLAYPARLNLPQVLLSVASLISGGVRGVVAK